MKRILIIEDDPKIATYLHDFIEKYGFDVSICETFKDIMDEFERYHPHLVLLDINLPYFDGFYWCLKIRQKSTCPVIFITARTDEMDHVRALENGGDDYITKPFHPEVVIAKVKSQLRRAYGEYALQGERIVVQNGLQLFPERLELHYNDKTITLSKRESDVMEMLMTRYPRVAGREDLLEKLWDDHVFIDDNTLNVNITRVRKRLRELDINEAVETVRSVGYRLNITW